MYGRSFWSRGSTPARALAFVVALLVLLVSLSAEAKKKKRAAKKHKTPAAKSKGKGKEALPPEPAVESDEASSDEKPAAEDDEKSKPTPSPEPEEDAPKPAPKAAKASPAKDSDAGGGLVAFRFGIGGRALFRNVTWTGDMGQLAPYSLSPGPQLGLWLEAFPAAFATDSFAANIGVFGHFNLGFGASSTTPAGATLTTKYQDFLAGLKLRVPFGAFQPYVAIGYGMQKFALEPADATRPNLSYGLVFIGAGARLQVTPAFDIDLAGGYLHVLGTGTGAGEFGALYPRATALGIDVSLSAGLRVTSMIGVRAGVDFRQFGLATNYVGGNPGIPAVGGVDRNITAWGGLELVFDGVGGGGGGGSGSDEEEPANKPPAKAKKPPAEGEPEESETEE
jgi:hypothetical protein